MLRQTTLILAGLLMLAGCQGSGWFSKPKPRAVADPQEPIRIVGGFFGQNAPQSTAVKVVSMVGDRRTMAVPFEMQVQMASGLQVDSRPLKSGQDVENVRGTTSTPLAEITFNGPNGALILYLDTYGLSLGNQGNHRLYNPALATHLRRLFTNAGLMQGRLGQVLELSLKKAAGQANIYQQPPMDVAVTN